MGETALYQAVEMENLNQIETLLKNEADPNLSRNDGWTPLHAAVLKQNIPLVEALLKSGANSNAKNKLYSQTPVHFAIKNSVKSAILLLLVQYNGSLSIRDKNNMRPLDYVNSDEMREVISILKTQREDAFITPQKERGLSIHSTSNHNIHNNNYVNNIINTTGSFGVMFNINSASNKKAKKEEEKENNNNQNNQNNFQNFTPTKTPNYILNKLIIKSNSDKTKNLSYHNNNFNNNCNNNTDSNNKSNSESKNIINNHAFSPSEYCAHNTDNMNMDHKFDSFVTGVGLNLTQGNRSKMTSPREKEDEGISDINPLETIYSNYNNNVNNNYNSSPNTTNTRKEEFSNFVYNENNSHITEHENEDSINHCHNEEQNFEEIDVDEINEIIEDSLEEDEEFRPVNSINTGRKITCVSSMRESQAKSSQIMDFNFYTSGNNEDDDDLQYTPSKTSYIISDLPVTSAKKNENSSAKKVVNRALNFRREMSSGTINSSNINSCNNVPINLIINNEVSYDYNLNQNANNNANNTIKNLYAQNNMNTMDFKNKIKYHNKENNNNNIQEYNFKQINNTHNNTQNNNKKVIQTYSNQPKHSSNQRINQSPEYIRKLNFSNFNEDTETVSSQGGRSLSRPQNHSHFPSNQIISKMTSNCSSTRHNSYHEEFPRRKIYLNDTINPHDLSNKTIIHYPIDQISPTARNTASNIYANANTLANTHCNTNANSIQNSIVHQNYPQNYKQNYLQNNAQNSARKNSANSAYKQTITNTNPNSKFRKLNLNYINDTNYCITENITGRSNISTNEAKILHEWLNSIGMQNYYINFLEKGLYNIEKLIEEMNDVMTRMTYKDFEELGVRKPGHIYRMLIKLEIDAKLIDENVYNLLLRDNNNNTSNNFNPNVSCNLRISKEKTVCCNLFDINKVNYSSNLINEDNINFKNKNGNNNINYDLISWLKKLNLSHLRKNFIHNGFDSMEFFILQMFSLNHFEDKLVEDVLHIYSKKERRIILNQLQKEVKLINSRLYNNSNNSYFMNDGDSLRFEKENVEEGCKMCLIY